MILLDLIARVVLFPILVVQALNVRHVARQLPEAAGPRRGRVGSGDAFSLFILGDSSAAGVGVKTQESALSGQLVRRLAASRAVDWHLNARTGRTTRQMLEEMDEDAPARVDIAVIALGVNDVTRGVPLPIWRRRQVRLIERLRARGAQFIILTALPPVHLFPLLPQPLRWVLGRQARRFDQTLVGLATAPDVVHLTIPIPDMSDRSLMAEDGFHPAAPTYALWAEAAAKIIEQRLYRSTACFFNVSKSQTSSAR
ncbi:SGNH/GDSL hydrolase family protein [Pontivivens insulae]|uniref:SGNH hydrolase-type esterase domain-containing protein n=1 Tax=Pontivivens insulae TaxID=1639689 RepID=A0A2R8AB87_9RHOB|nr:SGNH/GDSL hydrolase family protein [Pontivivens insulae]RED13263.1 lysophospholipase L1-like esterase [Pontivivens insulae]SPF29355.1 hypothetical protein POI8812_01663 [Pontivivens insulae]